MRHTGILATLVISAAYWQFVCHQTGRAEPWDAASYWLIWYPGSFGLAAVAGMFANSRKWLPGVIVTLAQLPVMWANNGFGGLVVLGLPVLCALAIPPAGISALSGWLAATIRKA